MQIFLYVLLACLVLPQLAQAETSYLTPVAADWDVRTLLTVGQSAANGYAMVGVPDGLGAFANSDGSFTLLMNHELAADKGAVRAHGQKGAFVSRWVIDAESLQVRSGADLVRATLPIDMVKPFNRLCSADLAPQSAFYNAASSKGYAGQLFLNGEEDKAGGRAFAHALDGTSYVLQDFGHIAWENLLANPASGDKTLVMGLDDIQDGLVLIYVGEKHSQSDVKSSPIAQAGLSGGKLYALNVEGSRFQLVTLTDGMTNLDGKTLREQAKKLGASGFARPEDGAWDTLNPKMFWFATTDKIGGDSRLTRIVFDDLADPQRGGRVETMLRAHDIGAEMFDNVTVDTGGRVLVEEDPGEQERLAAIWLFDPIKNRATKLFEANALLFKANAADFMTIDEEHSGIIEVTELLRKASWFDAKRRYYLGTTQAHLKHNDDKLVEHGQLWMISGPLD